MHRWDGYHYNLDEDVLAEAFSTPDPSIEDSTRDRGTTSPRTPCERSELIGFWVAWHLAGGFDALERGGWHRATIFRKVRRFRSRYGTHPDEYVFPWITLDLEKAWAERHLPPTRSGPQPRLLRLTPRAPCPHCPAARTASRKYR